MSAFKLPAAIFVVISMSSLQLHAQAADAASTGPKRVTGVSAAGIKPLPPLVEEPQQKTQTSRLPASADVGGPVASGTAASSDSGSAGTAAAVSSKAAQEQMRKASPHRLQIQTPRLPQPDRVIGEKSLGGDRVIGEKSQPSDRVPGQDGSSQQKGAGGDRVIGEK